MSFSCIYSHIFTVHSLHLSDLQCTLWVTQHPTEPSCTLLRYAAPSWAMLHPSELYCTIRARLSTLHPTLLLWTLFNYPAPFWAMLHPSELLHTLLTTLHQLSNAVSYWASLNSCEFCCSLWATLHSTELSCILLSYPKSQSTYIYRAPQCMSPRWNWDSHHPLCRKRVCPPPGTKGWGGTLACC